MWILVDNIVVFFFVSQLWCAAGVITSGGRASDLTKQTKGSQCSLDQLEQEGKVSLKDAVVTC